MDKESPQLTRVRLVVFDEKVVVPHKIKPLIILHELYNILLLIVIITYENLG